MQSGKDATYVGRIREDHSVANGLNLWVVVGQPAQRRGAQRRADRRDPDPRLSLVKTCADLLPHCLAVNHQDYYRVRRHPAIAAGRFNPTANHPSSFRAGDFDFPRNATRIIGSGRTDAGRSCARPGGKFHRRARNLAAIGFCRGLNALTPDDITIKEVEVVADDFDARRDGRSRIYEYHILNRYDAVAVLSKSRLACARTFGPCRDAARRSCALPGEHDFSSFRAAGCDATHPIRKFIELHCSRAASCLSTPSKPPRFSATWCATSSARLVEVGRRAAHGPIVRRIARSARPEPSGTDRAAAWTVSDRSQILSAIRRVI